MSEPSTERVVRLALVVSDPGYTRSFLEEAFDFILVGERTGDEADTALLGLPASRMRETTMRLGDQEIALLSFDPPGRPYPSGSTSTDLWFQHFAIIVSDMAAAYDRLQAAGRFVPISDGGPQVLPPSSGSVSAFKFRDAEGHPLELLAFPEGKGPAVWQRKRGEGLFLGIDHSAISVADTTRTIAFFKQGLGLTIGEQTENAGPEQARMDAVPDARVTVSGLKPAKTPPHVELLGYQVGLRRPIDGTTRSDDIAATQFILETRDISAVAEALTAVEARFVSPGIVTLADKAQAIMVLDPDGHRIVVRQPAG